MIRCVKPYCLAVLAGALVTACANTNTTACTVATGDAVARRDTDYNGKCAPGEVLVGYSTSAIGGPLLCATLTANCPVPQK